MSKNNTSLVNAAILPLELKKITENDVLEKTDTDIRLAAIDVLSNAISFDGLIIASEYQGFIDKSRKILGQKRFEESSVRVMLLRKLLNAGALSDSLESFIAKLENRYVSAELANDVMLSVVQCITNDKIMDEKILGLVDKALRVIPGELAPDLVDARLQLRAESQSILTSAMGKFASVTIDKSKNIFSSTQYLLTRFLNNKELGYRDDVRITSEANKRAISSQVFASSIRDIACVTNDDELSQHVDNYIKSIKIKDFRVCLVGEMKRGKSSIFNALAGEVISPIGESLATTAAVVELTCSNAPCYKGKWISNEDVAFIKSKIKAHKNNVFVQGFEEVFEWLLTSSEYSPGGDIPNILSIDDIPQLVTAGAGSMAPIVGKVSVGLPLPHLQEGTMIIDSPGINDPIQVRDEITFRHASTCQCIIMVMSAQQLCTNTESEFLQRLVDSGVAARLIIAITHSDLVPEQKLLVEEVKGWLGKILTCSEDGKKLYSTAEICLVDAAEAMRRVSSGNRQDKDFLELCKTIQKQIDGLEMEGGLSSHLLKLQKSLLKHARNSIDKYEKEIDLIIPNKNVCVGLRKQSETFVSMIKEFHSMVGSRLSAVHERLSFQKKTFNKDLENNNRNLRVRVESVYRSEVEKYGDKYPSNDWDKFSQTTVQMIVDEQLTILGQYYEEQFKLWEIELEGFSKEMQRLVPTSLEKLKSARLDLANICKKNKTYTAAMYSIDRFTDKLRKGSMYGGIAGAGMVYLGATSLLPQVALLSVMAFAAGKLWSTFTNTDARKEKFISSHVDETMEKIDEYLVGLDDKITSDLNKVGENFMKIATEHYEPLIKEAILAALEANYNADIFDKVRQDSIARLNDMYDVSCGLME